MNFGTLKTEFFAAGWKDWDDGAAGEARAARLLNETNRALCAEERWPFLYKTATGEAPLTIADLLFVREVTDSDNERVLTHMDEDDLRFEVADLTRPGTPLLWYRSPAISVYPVSSVNLRVDYVKRPALLVGDSDEPDVPEEYRTLILMGAWLRANLYKDNAGSEAAAVLRGEYERGVAQMRSLLVAQAEAGQMRVTSEWVG